MTRLVVDCPGRPMSRQIGTIRLPLRPGDAIKSSTSPVSSSSLLPSTYPASLFFFSPSIQGDHFSLPAGSKACLFEVTNSKYPCLFSPCCSIEESKFVVSVSKVPASNFDELRPRLRGTAPSFPSSSFPSYTISHFSISACRHLVDINGNHRRPLAALSRHFTSLHTIL